MKGLEALKILKNKVSSGKILDYSIVRLDMSGKARSSLCHFYKYGEGGVCVREREDICHMYAVFL